jgi:hypothetical protein
MAVPFAAEWCSWFVPRPNGRGKRVIRKRIKVFASFFKKKALFFFEKRTKKLLSVLVLATLESGRLS